MIINTNGKKISLDLSDVDLYQMILKALLSRHGEGQLEAAIENFKAGLDEDLVNHQAGHTMTYEQLEVEVRAIIMERFILNRDKYDALEDAAHCLDQLINWIRDEQGELE